MGATVGMALSCLALGAAAVLGSGSVNNSFSAIGNAAGAPDLQLSDAGRSSVPVATASSDIVIELEIGFRLWATVLGCVVMLTLWLEHSDVPRRWALRSLEWAEERALQTSSKFVVALSRDETVHHAVSKLVGQGINEWMVAPATQERLQHFVASTPEREVAQQLGKQAPTLARSFLEGMGGEIMFSVTRTLLYNDQARALRKVVGLGSGSGIQCMLVPAASG